MKLNEELIKVKIMLDDLKTDLKDIKTLSQRIESLEQFNAYIKGAIGILMLALPTILYLVVQHLFR